MDGGYAWLAVLAVVNTVASVFYYLRWIAPAFRPRDDAASHVPDRRFAPAGRWSAVAAVTAAVLAVALGVLSGLVLPLLTGPLATGWVPRRRAAAVGTALDHRVGRGSTVRRWPPVRPASGPAPPAT